MQFSTEQLFTQARTQNGYKPTAVSDEQLPRLSFEEARSLV